MDYRKGNYLLSYIDCRSFKKNKLYKILDANVIKMSISADGEWIEKVLNPTIEKFKKWNLK
jgi:hypothetical protein